MPGPVLLVQPTVELGKRFSRQRVDPLIAGTPRLSRKVAPSRSRDSGNTMLSKEFPGGIVIITGANSAVGLRSMPAQYAFLDEIDGYPADVNEEGSPLSLVEARQETYGRRRKSVKVSTPTIAGRSAIEEAYEASDQRRYHVPCPHCGELQPLEFARLTWTKWSRPPERAAYECCGCGAAIEEHCKAEMLAHGLWIPEAPGEDRARGYHISALYSPWMPWGKIAKRFVAAHANPEKLRAFINLVLGEVWTSKGEAPAWEGLMRRREEYPIGVVPPSALFLTAGCDVQKDRVVVEVVGWGRGKQSWSVDYSLLPGDTADLERGPYRQLDELLSRTYSDGVGHEIPIRMLAIDSGFNTQTVYTWARKYPMNRVIAVKGHSNGGVLIGSPSPVEVMIGGRKSKRGGRVWPVASNLAKSELYGWLRLEIPPEGGDAPAGYCHFPQYGEEYFKQLTAEQLVPHKTRKGYVRLEWELIPGRENHVLDARVYARAAAALIGLDRYRESDWTWLDRAVATPIDEQPATPAAPGHAAPAPRERWIPPRQGGWLRGRN
jgi:phage terminase large subunit GpA-like protein